MFVLFLADGFEEVEALAPLDMLRRAGCQIVTAAIGEIPEVIGSHGVKITADTTVNQLDKNQIEGVILPGGMPGAANLEKSEAVKKIVLSCAAEKRLVAAICAAPYVLGKWGVLKEKQAICYPGYEDLLEGAFLSQAPVCIDGNIITGKGAGVAVDFGLALVEVIYGAEVSAQIREKIQCS